MEALPLRPPPQGEGNDSPPPRLNWDTSPYPTRKQTEQEALRTGYNCCSEPRLDGAYAPHICETELLEFWEDESNADTNVRRSTRLFSVMIESRPIGRATDDDDDHP